MKRQAEHAAHGAPLVVFRRTHLRVDIHAVREIIRMRESAGCRTRRSSSGVISLRGKICPVMDLRMGRRG
jgi:chemotaxis signal transduction protein